MKFFHTSHKFDHSWAQVTAANWQKYPNEQCPHVIAVDVLSRHVDPNTGVLHTERLLTCNQNAPALILKVKKKMTRSISPFFFPLPQPCLSLSLSSLSI
ncbi:MAG: PRELI-like family-domain-containing protein [Benniella sp.]|nr:MAG: PRELI-like family-domain-containing protein [Benniella sp.]